MNADLFSWGVDTYSFDIMWADIFEDKNGSGLMFLDPDFFLWGVDTYSSDVMWVDIFEFELILLVFI